MLGTRVLRPTHRLTPQPPPPPHKPSAARCSFAWDPSGSGRRSADYLTKRSFLAMLEGGDFPYLQSAILRTIAEDKGAYGGGPEEQAAREAAVSALFFAIDCDDGSGRRVAIAQASQEAGELMESAVSYSAFVNFISFDKGQIWMLARMVRERMLAKRQDDISFDRLFAELGGRDLRQPYVKLGRLQKYIRQELHFAVTDSETDTLVHCIEVSPNGQIDKKDLLDFIDAEHEEHLLAQEAADGHPIYAIAVTGGAAQLLAPPTLEQQGYRQLYANVNASGTGSSGPVLHIWTKRCAPAEARDAPIVQVAVSRRSADVDLVARGFVCLAQNLNEGNVGRAVYLWYRRARGQEARDAPLLELGITTGLRKRGPLDKVWLPPSRGFFRCKSAAAVLGASGVAKAATDAAKNAAHDADHIARVARDAEHAEVLEVNLNARNPFADDCFLWSRHRSHQEGDRTLGAGPGSYYRTGRVYVGTRAQHAELSQPQLRDANAAAVKRAATKGEEHSAAATATVVDAGLTRAATASVISFAAQARARSGPLHPDDHNCRKLRAMMLVAREELRRAAVEVGANGTVVRGADVNIDALYDDMRSSGEGSGGGLSQAKLRAKLEQLGLNSGGKLAPMLFRAIDIGGKGSSGGLSRADLQDFLQYTAGELDDAVEDMVEHVVLGGKKPKKGAPKEDLSDVLRRRFKELSTDKGRGGGASLGPLCVRELFVRAFHCHFSAAEVGAIIRRLSAGASLEELTFAAFESFVRGADDRAARRAARVLKAASEVRLWCQRMSPRRSKAGTELYNAVGAWSLVKALGIGAAAGMKSKAMSSFEVERMLRLAIPLKDEAEEAAARAKAALATPSRNPARARTAGSGSKGAAAAIGGGGSGGGGGGGAAALSTSAASAAGGGALSRRAVNIAGAPRKAKGSAALPAWEDCGRLSAAEVEMLCAYISPGFGIQGEDKSFPHNRRGLPAIGKDELQEFVRQYDSTQPGSVASLAASCRQLVQEARPWLKAGGFAQVVKKQREKAEARGKKYKKPSKGDPAWAGTDKDGVRYLQQLFTGPEGELVTCVPLALPERVFRRRLKMKADVEEEAGRVIAKADGDGGGGGSSSRSSSGSSATSDHVPLMVADPSVHGGLATLLRLVQHVRHREFAALHLTSASFNPRDCVLLALQLDCWVGDDNSANVHRLARALYYQPSKDGKAAALIGGPSGARSLAGMLVEGARFVRASDGASFKGAVEELKAHVRREAMRRGSRDYPDYRAVFDKVDVNASGSVDLDEFYALLQQMGVEDKLSGDEVEELLDRFDSDGNGSVDFDEFRRFAVEEPPDYAVGDKFKSGHTPPGKKKAISTGDAAVDAACKKIGENFRKLRGEALKRKQRRQKGRASGDSDYSDSADELDPEEITLERIFLSLDTDSSGNVTAQALRRGIVKATARWEAIGRGLTRADIDALCEHFYVDRGGRHAGAAHAMDVDEFLDHMEKLRKEFEALQLAGTATAGAETPDLKVARVVADFARTAEPLKRLLRPAPAPHGRRRRRRGSSDGSGSDRSDSDYESDAEARKAQAGHDWAHGGTGDRHADRDLRAMRLALWKHAGYKRPRELPTDAASRGAEKRVAAAVAWKFKMGVALALLKKAEKEAGGQDKAARRRAAGTVAPAAPKAGTSAPKAKDDAPILSIRKILDVLDDFGVLDRTEDASATLRLFAKRIAKHCSGDGDGDGDGDGGSGSGSAGANATPQKARHRSRAGSASSESEGEDEDESKSDILADDSVVKRKGKKGKKGKKDKKGKKARRDEGPEVSSSSGDESEDRRAKKDKKGKKGKKDKKSKRRRDDSPSGSSSDDAPPKRTIADEFSDEGEGEGDSEGEGEGEGGGSAGLPRESALVDCRALLALLLFSTFDRGKGMPPPPPKLLQSAKGARGDGVGCAPGITPAFGPTAGVNELLARLAGGAARASFQRWGRRSHPVALAAELAEAALSSGGGRDNSAHALQQGGGGVFFADAAALRSALCKMGIVDGGGQSSDGGWRSPPATAHGGTAAAPPKLSPADWDIITAWFSGAGRLFVDAVARVLCVDVGASVGCGFGSCGDADGDVALKVLSKVMRLSGRGRGRARRREDDDDGRGGRSRSRSRGRSHRHHHRHHRHGDRDGGKVAKRKAAHEKMRRVLERAARADAGVRSGDLSKTEGFISRQKLRSVLREQFDFKGLRACHASGDSAAAATTGPSAGGALHLTDGQWVRMMRHIGAMKPGPLAAKGQHADAATAMLADGAAGLETSPVVECDVVAGFMSLRLKRPGTGGKAAGAHASKAEWTRVVGRVHAAIVAEYGDGSLAAGAYAPLLKAVASSSRKRSVWSRGAFLSEMFVAWRLRLTEREGEQLLAAIEAGDEAGGDASNVEFGKFEALLKIACKGPPVHSDDEDDDDDGDDDNEHSGSGSGSDGEFGGRGGGAAWRELARRRGGRFGNYYNRAVSEVAARFAIEVAAAAARGEHFWRACSYFAHAGGEAAVAGGDPDHEPEMIDRGDFEHVVVTKLVAGRNGGRTSFSVEELDAIIEPLRSLRRVEGEATAMAVDTPGVGSGRWGHGGGGGDEFSGGRSARHGPPPPSHANDRFDIVELRGAVGTAAAMVAPGALQALGGVAASEGAAPTGTAADVLVGYGPYGALAQTAAGARPIAMGLGGTMGAGGATMGGFGLGTLGNATMAGGTMAGYGLGAEADGLPAPLDPFAATMVARDAGLLPGGGAGGGQLGGGLRLAESMRADALAASLGVGGLRAAGMGGALERIDPALRQKLRERVQRASAMHAEKAARRERPLGSKAPAPFRLLAPFEELDTWNSGSLPLAQFKQVLRSPLCLALDAAELDELLNALDPTGSGAVPYREFARLVAVDEAEANLLAARLQERFVEVGGGGGGGGRAVRDAFAMFDLERAGFISRREFKEASRQVRCRRCCSCCSCRATPLQRASHQRFPLPPLPLALPTPATPRSSACRCSRRRSTESWTVSRSSATATA